MRVESRLNSFIINWYASKATPGMAAEGSGRAKSHAVLVSLDQRQGLKDSGNHSVLANFKAAWSLLLSRR